MLVLIGVNHESAPVEIRERLAFPESELGPALSRLVAHDGVAEALVLSTCNRVEVLVSSDGAERATATVRDFLARERGVEPERLDGHLYRHVGPEAVRHLFEVACGLDSMILGEPQILGQVKQAYRAARAAGSTGPILDHLLQQGFATAKQIRTETGIARHAVSIAFAAIELARKIFGELGGRSVLVLGAGKMAHLAVRHLVAHGIGRIVVASRTFEHASSFARDFGGTAVPWDEAVGHLDEVDVVVAGTGAPGLVLRRDDVKRAVGARRNRPLFIIDIAVPRDVEPTVNQLDNVYLYDIDDLQGIVEDNVDERRRSAIEARRRVAVQVEAFERWEESLRLTPTIVALRETLLGLGRDEIERFRRRLAGLSPEEARAVEELTRAVIHKILHRPIRHLKTLSRDGDAGAYAAVYRDIFGLDVVRDDDDDDTAVVPREPARRAEEG